MADRRGLRPEERRAEIAFLRRVLIAAAVVALALFLWVVRGPLLLVFAAILVAVMLRMLADPLSRFTGIGMGWAVFLAGMAVGLPLLATFLLIGNEMREQVARLVAALPEAAEAIYETFGLRIPLPIPSGPGSPPPPDPSAVGAVASQVASVALFAADTLATLVLVAVGGLYIASAPAIYWEGIGNLVPQGAQARIEDALEATGKALRLWLKAQLAAMAAVGTLVGLGAWAIGLPSPLVLGLFAGLVEVVPLIGPFLGAAPAVLVAVNMGWEMVAWTAALYFAVQQVEGYLITPMLGERMVAIPPALLLFSIIAAGSVFGLAGVVLAAPLTVVAVVLVGKLYVRETLGHPVEVPGEAEE